MLQWFDRVAPAVMCALFVVSAIPGGGPGTAFRLGWIALAAAVIAAITFKFVGKDDHLARAVTNGDEPSRPEGSFEGQVS